MFDVRMEKRRDDNTGHSGEVLVVHLGISRRRRPAGEQKIGRPRCTNALFKPTRVTGGASAAGRRLLSVDAPEPLFLVPTFPPLAEAHRYPRSTGSGSQSR